MRWSVYGKHGDIMKNNLTLSLKKNIYNQCILQLLTYGSETWQKEEEERKLRSEQSEMERKMLGITWNDRKRETWIKEKTKSKGNYLERPILCSEQTTDR